MLITTTKLATLKLFNFTTLQQITNEELRNFRAIN